MGVAEENARLRDEVRRAEYSLASMREEKAELTRLRDLMAFSPPETWHTMGARVLTGRFGPAAALESVMINRGFASGAAPGTPLVTHQGLAGRVFRASAHTATVLLLTDRAFRVAVVTEKGRVPGVLAGTGARANLEVRYVAPNMPVEPGELLVTSGLDGDFPKGVPVARVISAEPGNETLFQQVQAAPLVPLDTMEEALLLIPPAEWPGRQAARADAREPVPPVLRQGAAKGAAVPSGTVNQGTLRRPAAR